MATRKTSKKTSRKTATRKPAKKTARKATAKKTTKKTARKAPVRKTAAGKSRGKRSVDARNSRLDGLTIDLICDSANNVHKHISRKKKPDLSFPIRSLKNVSYSTRKGYFEIGNSTKVRTLTVNTVKSFAQTLRMMGLSKELVETNDFAA